MTALGKVFGELRRLGRASLYSLAGLRAAWEGEAAFRTECVLLVIALPLAYWLAEGPWQFTALVGSMLLVMIVEIVNSAIEAAVDRIGPERHPLSGRAKDLGSAAVLLAALLSLMVWISAATERFAG